MDIISTQTLKSLVALSEKRDSLLSEVEKINHQLKLALSGKIPSKQVNATSKSSTADRRGAVKDLVVSALKSAGEAGVSVQELAAKLGMRNQNLHVWFSSTGKKLGVKKVRPGVYRLP